VLVKKYRKNTSCIFKILRLNIFTTGLHLFYLRIAGIRGIFYSAVFLTLFDLVVRHNLPVPVPNFIMQEWLMPTAVPLFDRYLIHKLIALRYHIRK
jgi:hypothetical protein